jgi:hypothetical protein
VPLSAVVPVRALSFFAIASPHVSPFSVPIPTPTDIVASGATLVRLIVTVPVVPTVNGVPVVAEWVTIPENVSVVVTGVGVLGDELDPHPAASSRSVAAIDRPIDRLLIALCINACLPSTG